MSEEIRCEVFQIQWPIWSSVTEELRESIWQVLSQRVEDGERPSRKGFVGVNRLEGVVAGFFAHEDRRLGVQYDGNWKREDKEAPEFEHLFFALVLSQGQVVLQHKRVERGFVTINLPTMRRAFFDLLTVVFQRAGLACDRVVKQEFHEERSKEDLVEIFGKYHVTYIKVGELLGRRVPEDVDLFNPDIVSNPIKSYLKSPIKSCHPWP